MKKLGSPLHLEKNTMIGLSYVKMLSHVSCKNGSHISNNLIINLLNRDAFVTLITYELEDDYNFTYEYSLDVLPISPADNIRAVLPRVARYTSIFRLQIPPISRWQCHRLCSFVSEETGQPPNEQCPRGAGRLVRLNDLP